MHSHATLDMDRVVDDYRDHGFVVIEDVVPPALLDAAMDSLAPEGGIQRYNASGKVDFRKLPNLAARQEIFRRLACQPNITRVVNALLGQAALVFRDVMVVKPARQGAHLDYHQDSAYWDVEPKTLVSAWIPMSDVTLQNGCLKVIDRSHLSEVQHDILVSDSVALPTFAFRVLRRAASLSGTGDSDAAGFSTFRKAKNAVLGTMTRHVSFLGRLQDLHARVAPEQREQSIDLPVKRGSVIFFHSLMLHASNRNTTDRDRCAYIVSYMGEDFLYTGVGEPELLVASETDRPVYKKARIAHAVHNRT